MKTLTKTINVEKQKQTACGKGETNVHTLKGVWHFVHM